MMRAEFYTNEGKPFMINGRHATISTLTEFPDHLIIPVRGNLSGFNSYKFARLAVSTDGQVALYALEKVREWERGNA